MGLINPVPRRGDLDSKGRDQILTWLLGRAKGPAAIAKLRPMLKREPDAADKLAHQAAGEFFLVREGRILALARTQMAARLNPPRTRLVPGLRPGNEPRGRPHPAMARPGPPHRVA